MPGRDAYVLAPRQMGKSSLMVRTAEALRDEGIRSVIIDLSSIGAEGVTQEQWHLGLLDLMGESLDLETDVIAWWQTYAHLGMSQRLILFYEEVLLAEVEVPVVILIDEIDTTLNLDFSDDFFAAIRYVYNARARVAAFERLSFVLIGVATPSELVSDPRRTPFNIGGRVDLTDFTFAEAKPFARGLGLPSDEAEQVLRWVLSWTGGHPFLTQRLCKVIADNHHDTWTEGDVEAVVHATFFGEQSEQDSNLLFIRDWLTGRSHDPLAVLSVYRNVRLGRRAVRDEEQSVVKSHLKLSGVVLRENGVLLVRNPIYETVFDRQWIKAHWPVSRLRRIPPAIWGLIVALVVVVGLLAWGLKVQQDSKQQIEEARDRLEDSRDSLNLVLKEAEFQSREAEEQARRADASAAVADSKAKEANFHRQFAVREAQRADSLRQEADSSAAVAESQRQIAVQEAARADEKTEEALRQRAEADKQRKVAHTEREIALSLALASKSIREQRTGDDELAALLARESYQFNKRTRGEYVHEVYDALRRILNKLDRGARNPQVFYAPDNDWIRAVAYGSDESIVAAGNEPDVYYWHRGQGRPRILKGRWGAVQTLALSPDSKVIAVGSVEGRVWLWRNLDEEEPTPNVLSEGLGRIRTVAFSPDGEHVAAAGDADEIRLWDREGNLVAALPSRGWDIRALAFSPNGKMLAAGSSSGLLYFTAWRQGEMGRTVESLHNGSINAVAFSPDGKLLATGGGDRRVHLLKVTGGEFKRFDDLTLEEHGGPVKAVAFSPDSKMLASGSGDGTVRLWQISNLDYLPVMLPDHNHWVHAVAFSENGQRLISGSADNTIRRWDIDVHRLAKAVCEAVDNRNLTEKQWKERVGKDISYRQYEPCPVATH